jgi:hypothetical protein
VKHKLGFWRPALSRGIWKLPHLANELAMSKENVSMKGLVKTHLSLGTMHAGQVAAYWALNSPHTKASRAPRINSQRWLWPVLLPPVVQCLCNPHRVYPEVFSFDARGVCALAPPPHSRTAGTHKSVRLIGQDPVSRRRVPVLLRTSDIEAALSQDSVLYWRRCWRGVNRMDCMFCADTG